MNEGQKLFPAQLSVVASIATTLWTLYRGLIDSYKCDDAAKIKFTRFVNRVEYNRSIALRN